jgi:hypothetical protein
VVQDFKLHHYLIDVAVQSELASSLVSVFWLHPRLSALVVVLPCLRGQWLPALSLSSGCWVTCSAVVELSGVTTPNVKNRTLRKLDHSIQAVRGRKGLNEPFRRRPEACQV